MALGADVITVPPLPQGRHTDGAAFVRADCAGRADSENCGQQRMPSVGRFLGWKRITTTNLPLLARGRSRLAAPTHRHMEPGCNVVAGRQMVGTANRAN